MNKNIRSWPVEMEENSFWFSDTLLGGLYRHYILTGETKCEINPTNLYSQGVFRIGGIVCWGEYVIICPLYTCGFIVVFSKQTRKIKKVVIDIKVEKYTLLEGARRIGSDLYLNLYRSNIAALIIELKELCSAKIKKINPQLILYPNSTIHTEWYAKCFQNAIYLPAYNEKIIYKVENKKISSINIQVPKNIFTICFYMSEIWGLSVDGDEAYKIDLNGKLQEVISMEKDVVLPKKSVAYNLYVTKNYIFFMLRTKALACYDRKKHCKVELNSAIKNCRNLYPNELPGTFLYAMEKEDQLLLLPYGGRGLEINLLTFDCNIMDILFPNKIDDGTITYYTEIALANKGNKLFEERGLKSLKVYLEYIEKSSIKKDLDVFKNYRGKEIYQIIKN